LIYSNRTVSWINRFTDSSIRVYQSYFAKLLAKEMIFDHSTSQLYYFYLHDSTSYLNFNFYHSVSYVITHNSAHFITMSFIVANFIPCSNKQTLHCNIKILRESSSYLIGCSFQKNGISSVTIEHFSNTP